MDPVRPNNNDMKEIIGSNQAEHTNMIPHNRSEKKHFCTYMCQTNRIKPSSEQERVFKGCCVRPSRELIEQVMEDEPKFVERTQGLCDNLDTTNTECLREADLSTGYASTTTLENSEFSDEKTTDEGENPNLLHLTKMQWLTDSQTDSTDSRSSTPPISRSVSFAVPESSDSEGDMKGCVSFGEKCLSTILRLDKEHNMFGLSNITIVDSKMLKKSRKDDKDPAFPQTTIIQLLCCEKKCCHKSNTDLPLSLKCGRCYSCTDPFCSSCKSCGIVCSLPCTLPCVVSARSSRALPCPKPSIRITPCGSPCGRRCRSPCRSPCFPPCRSPCSPPCRSPCSPPCRSPCRSPCARPSKIPFLKPTPCEIPCGSCCDNPPCVICCYKGRIKCKRVPCAKPRCLMDCNTRYGMKISLKRKPKFEPSPIEITPRSSCILKKPVAARSCHHLPRCSPPSSCFPYLMPCFWPPRASAPCNNPSRCFHNPPCLPPRRRKSPIPSQYSCTRDKKCLDETKNSICPNPTCPGKNETFKAEIEKRFGKGK